MSQLSRSDLETKLCILDEEINDLKKEIQKGEDKLQDAIKESRTQKDILKDDRAKLFAE